MVDALTRTGFRGPNSWYVNDDANIAYAAGAPDAGRLTMPVLMVHANRDAICDTAHSRLADPMRADCADLTEVTVDSGHEVMLERPAELNAALAEMAGFDHRIARRALRSLTPGGNTGRVTSRTWT